MRKLSAGSHRTAQHVVVPKARLAATRFRPPGTGARLRAARELHASVATVGVASETGTRTADVEVPQVPFGVFLAPAALVTLLWGQRLIEWYARRMQTL